MEEKQSKGYKEVLVNGWISQIRNLGGLKFFILRNREGEIQITLKKSTVSTSLFNLVSGLRREDYVSVKGLIKKSRQAPGGKEIVPEKIDILAKSDTPLPIDIGEHIKTNLNKRFDWRSLDLRNPRNLAIFKIQAKLVEGMEEYLRARGFLQVFTPCIMGAASESGADVFSIVYFNKEAFLRQDPQLHRQLLIAAGFDRIFDLGPSWRAEPSHTTRHICEFRGCAVELTIKDETDTMRIEEELIVHALKKIKKECTEELELLGKKIKIPSIPFPEIRFPKIYKILESMGKKIPEGEDYDRESEILLWEWVKKKYKTDFFFVNRFPFKVKPFYVMRFDKEPKWARSVDLLYKGLELSSGGQREHRYEKIIQQIKEKQMGLEGLEWFTKFFKFGVPAHGGFNIGIERLTQQLLDIKNIGEVVLFPRTPERFLP
jgi:aspartyl-tRNA synthetase